MATSNINRGRPALSKAEKARREKARASGEQVVTKIAQSRQIFSSFLPKVNTISRAEFRREVIAEIVKQTGSTPNTAATMYNTCKNEAEDTGLLAPGTVGIRTRGGIEVDPEVSWVVLQVIPVAQHTTREAAKAASGPGYRVLSTNQWLNEVGNGS